MNYKKTKLDEGREVMESLMQVVTKINGANASSSSN